RNRPPLGGPRAAPRRSQPRGWPQFAGAPLSVEPELHLDRLPPALAAAKSQRRAHGSDRIQDSIPTNSKGFSTSAPRRSAAPPPCRVLRRRTIPALGVCLQKIRVRSPSAF